jgi:tRNA-2-methylthio-N6-dimethylallyladenosine synthase
MNEYDSDKMADVLGAAQGYEQTTDIDQADLWCSTLVQCAKKPRRKCSPTWAACVT